MIEWERWLREIAGAKSSGKSVVGFLLSRPALNDMNNHEFTQVYPSLGPALGEFYDSQSADDERNAKETRLDLPAGDRAQLLARVLADAHQLMTNIDDHWEGLAQKANRQLDSRDQARDWLIRVIVSWQEELSRLQSNGSKP